MLNDLRSLRNVMGSFATGVTIVTTLDHERNPVGLTVNSFSSLSLEPALILWSLQKTSANLDNFLKGEFFCVNILKKEQLDTAWKFAKKDTEKFEHENYSKGVGGVPVLANCLSDIQCKRVEHYDCGDHVLFIGEVQDFNVNEGEPLLFYAGQFGNLEKEIAHAEQL